MRIEKLKQNFDIDVQLVHFPLHPETPADGVSLQQLFGTDADGVKTRQARMVGLMKEEGLPYGDRTHTYNSRLAQELGKWADTQPDGGAIHDALYRAYFVDGKNIGDIELLVSIAESVGLNGEAARNVLTQRGFKDAVDTDWEWSRSVGVTGVPTFAAAGSGVVGAQPYDVLVQLLQNAGAQEKAS